MKRLTAALCLFCLSTLHGFVCAADVAVPSPPSDERVNALIARLRSERFEDRDAAMAELRKLGDAAVPALKHLSVEGDPELKWRIEQLLGAQVASSDPETMNFDELVKAFGQEEGHNRLRLMRQIADMDSVRGRAFLVGLLVAAQDPAVLGQAVEQLSWLGGGVEETKAVQAFYNQCEDDLKGRTLWTLAGMDPAAARPLVHEALSSQNQDLKQWAIKTVGRCQDRESAEKLRPLARGGEEIPREQQMAALESLISLKDSELAAILPPLLKTDDRELFDLALRGVRAMRLPETVQMLLDLYNDQERKESRAALLGAMGAVGDARVIPVLREALSRDRNLRYAALQALSTLRAKEAGPDIIGCLSDPNNHVRVLAATALGQLGYREAIPQLQKVLKDRESQVSLAAAVALLNLGDSSGEDQILSLAQQEAIQGVQGGGALRLLGRYRIEKGIPLLKQLAAEGREDALWALMDLSPDKETFRLVLRQLLLNRDDGSGHVVDVQVALFFAQHHMYERAAAMLEELAKKQPGYGFVHSRLSNVYQEMGRYADAEKAFERWSQLEPEDGTYLNNRAWFYCTAYSKEYQRPAQCLALAARALAQRPDEHFIVDTYGWALYSAGRYEEALAELNRSLSMIEPADKEGQAGERVRIARALEKLGRGDEAVAQVRQAVQDAPKDAELWYQAAGYFASTGRRDEAVDALHRAVDLGYRNVTGFKLNGEFDSIRRDAGFQYAIRRVEKDLKELARVADEVEKEVRDAPVPAGERGARATRNVNGIRLIDGQVITIE